MIYHYLNIYFLGLISLIHNCYYLIQYLKIRNRIISNRNFRRIIILKIVILLMYKEFYFFYLIKSLNLFHLCNFSIRDLYMKILGMHQNLNFDIILDDLFQPVFLFLINSLINYKILKEYSLKAFFYF